MNVFLSMSLSRFYCICNGEFYDSSIFDEDDDKANNDHKAF